jgi:PRTRC genetic system protein A
MSFSGNTVEVNEDGSLSISGIPFPLYLNRKGTELPKKGTYYVLGKGGVFLHKDAGLLRATVRLDAGISSLQEVFPEAEWNFPPLPQLIAARALAFFRVVYKEHRSEAAVLLYYNPEEQVYELSCPDQVVSAGRVRYENPESIPGYRLVGSIHSHCNMSAYHSSIDHLDEMFFDGIHLTFGRVSEKTIEISAELAVNNNRFSFVPCERIEGLKVFEPPPEPPEEEPSQDLQKKRRRKKKKVIQYWPPRVTKYDVFDGLNIRVLEVEAREWMAKRVTKELFKPWGLFDPSDSLGTIGEGVIFDVFESDKGGPNGRV